MFKSENFLGYVGVASVYGIVSSNRFPKLNENVLTDSEKDKKISELQEKNRILSGGCRDC